MSNKVKQVGLRLTEFHHNEILNLSQNGHIKLSEWIRRVVLEKLEELRNG
jgi:hypothetical protein